MPDLKDFGGLTGLSGAAGGLGGLAALAGGGGHGGGHGGHGHGGGGGGGGLGGMGAIGLLAGAAVGSALSGNHNRNHHNNHRKNHHYGGGGYHHGHGGHGGFGGGGGFGHHGFGGGYGCGPGGVGVGVNVGGARVGVGYGMGGMGRYHGYGGGHHGYRGSAMRLPWLGALAATAVASSAAAVYPRGARSQVTWKEGNKQISSQVGGLTVNVARAQNLKSVSTMTTQDPYVKAKLLVDGYQVAEVKSGTHNNGGRNPDWTGKNNFFTFYVPSNMPLAKLAVVLEVYDDNSVSSDKMIGTCGKIALQGVADGKMRWWTVTSGGQLQASVYSDVKFGSKHDKANKGKSKKGKKNKKSKNKNKHKSQHRNQQRRNRQHHSGGGRNQNALRHEYNGYVNGMNNAGRNSEVLPFETWARGRYRSSSSSSSSSSDSDSYSDSDSNSDTDYHRKHGYGHRESNTSYAVPVGTTQGTAPPASYGYGGQRAPRNDFQSPDYRPPATAPSAPSAYPAAVAYPAAAPYQTAAGVPGQPQAPPPYPGAPQQQGAVYYPPTDSKR